ncbi:MAG: DUF934 domain-containing protein [Myxococcales bacterium]|nr:DUF934 domain-containing protein [Myxococcales bacterium]
MISERRIVDDAWISVEPGAALPAAGHGVVAFSDWLARKDTLRATNSPLGVRVHSDVDPAALAAEAPNFALIAIEFPTFKDGRGYSIARLLRDEHGYRGDLRAVGHVLRDQLLAMERVGFTSFELAPGKSLESAVEAFAEFSHAYEAIGAGITSVRALRRRA